MADRPSFSVTSPHPPAPSLVTTRAPDAAVEQASLRDGGASTAARSEPEGSRSETPARRDAEAIGTEFYLAIGALDGAPSEELTNAQAHVGEALALIQRHRENIAPQAAAPKRSESK